MRRLVRGALFLMGLALALPAAAQSEYDPIIQEAETARIRGDFATVQQKYAILCESDAGFCQLAGNAFLDGVLVPQDYKIAADFFRKGCEKAFAPSCQFLGRISLGGHGATGDYEIAYRSLLALCDDHPGGPFSSGAACIDLADLLKANTQMRQTLGDAVYFGAIESTLTKGCKRHRAPASCIQAAEIVLERLDAARSQPILFQTNAGKVRELLDAAAEFSASATGMEGEYVQANFPRLNQLLEDKLAGRN